MTAASSQDRFLSRDSGEIQAIFLGQRIDTRELEREDLLSVVPLTFRVGQDGYAIVFRYGVVVLVNLEDDEAQAFLRQIMPLVLEPFEEPENERVSVLPAADETERVDADGTLRLKEISLERLQVVAHVLAKSTVLAHYEESVAATFERIETLAEQLKQRTWRLAAGGDLLTQIGEVLMVMTQTVGRVEVAEKPEITWDHRDLDRLYERLSLEYELRERDLALTRKLDFISQSAQTYLNLLQSRQSLRVEWYIVLLIVVELVLIVYERFFL